MTILGIGFALCSFLLFLVVRLFKKNRQLKDEINIANEFNRKKNEQLHVASLARPNDDALLDGMRRGEV